MCALLRQQSGFQLLGIMVFEVQLGSEHLDRVLGLVLRRPVLYVQQSMTTSVYGGADFSSAWGFVFGGGTC